MWPYRITGGVIYAAMGAYCSLYAMLRAVTSASSLATRVESGNVDILGPLPTYHFHPSRVARHTMLLGVILAIYMSSIFVA